MELIDNIVNGFLYENKNLSGLSQKAIDKLISWDNNEDKKTIERPHWNDYFLTLAFVISQRSIDGRTKHGCVFVKEKKIISVGYNAYISNIPDYILPNLSHAKLSFINHSEENAIVNAAKEGVSCDGTTAYITGPPCNKCLLLMHAAGIKQIIHGNKKSVSLEQDENYKINQEIIDWLTSRRLSIIEHKLDKEFINILKNVLDEALI